MNHPEDNIFIPMSSEMVGPQTSTDPLMVVEERRTAPPPDNFKTNVDLDTFQKNLLEEMKKNPKLMNLMKVIFGDYPNAVIADFQSSNPHASPSRRKKFYETRSNRLRLEAFIELTVAELSGIDLGSVKSASTDQSTSPQEETTEEVIEDTVEDTKVLSVRKKVKNTKKKTKKKSS